MTQILKSIIGRYVVFLPLIIFMGAYHAWSSWDTAFVVGGVAACLYLLFVFYEHIKHDLFVTGANCFLIGGMCMVLFKIRWLGAFYKYFGYSTVLVWIFIVGLIATIFSPSGFIAESHRNKHLITLFSGYLLAGTFLAIVFSMYFSKQIFAFAALPFIFLFVLRAALVDQLKRRS